MVHAGNGWGGGGGSCCGSAGTSGLLVVVNGVGGDARNGFRPPSLLHVQMGFRNLAVVAFPPRELTGFVSKYCCVAINELEFGRK